MEEDAGLSYDSQAKQFDPDGFSKAYAHDYGPNVHIAS